MHTTVKLFSKQEPVELSCLAPLSLLSKVLSLEQQLLATVTEHEGIAGSKVSILINLIARHLLYHRALEMYHLIM